MPRGGARPGSGRKKGSPNKALAAVRDRAMRAGSTPIEVLLSAMRGFWPHEPEKAAQYAAMAAPYVHPRLSAVNAVTTVEHTGDTGSDIRRLAMFMLASLREAREHGNVIDVDITPPAPGTLSADSAESAAFATTEAST